MTAVLDSAFCTAAAEASRAGAPWFFNPCLVIGEWDRWALGVWLTLELTVLAMALGFLLALPLAFALSERTPIAAPFARGFVYVFRGSPLLVQVFLIYYGLSQFVWVRESALWPLLREAWWCALIAFTLNSAAYQAEILRGAIAATPRGEKEAATALGMSPLMTARRIVIPSALRRALPQMGNEFIFMLHGSALASVITLQDILGVGRMINGRYYVVYEGLLTAAVLYMILTYLGVWALGRLERRYTRHLIR
ncbi:MAG: ABC transporter permease [Rubrimonas sp.]|uniref:ABC transporter permease n=1 Tax=Rubrimonas sp. TaxID=2036015 RepID=UPI002FDD0C36